MKPYYQDDWVTIYHADAVEALPSLVADVLNRRLLDALANARCKWRFINVQVLSANRALIWSWIGDNARRVKDVMVWLKRGQP